MDDTHKQEVLTILRWLKDGPPGAIPVVQHGRQIASLVALTWRDVDEASSITLLAHWREQANPFFPAQFPVTFAGTRQWLIKQVLELPERLLFWVQVPGGEPIGHVGLFRFDFAAGTVEIDNIVRGREQIAPGVMTASVQTLCNWSFEALRMRALLLRVMSDNVRAIRLYRRCGFEEVLRTPLTRVQEGDVVRWVEVEGDQRLPVMRYQVTMRLFPAQTARRAA
jgi:RimJ/RimL family protein N-acetyltransferase